MDDKQSAPGQYGNHQQDDEDQPADDMSHWTIGKPAFVEQVIFISVENCRNDIAPGLLCPETWDGLIATDNPDKRYCNKCRHHVHRARNRWSLRWARLLGRCVAYGPDRQ